MSGGELAMFETECAADLRARKEADRLDLKVFVRSLAGTPLRVGERFLGVFISGDEDMGESSSGGYNNG